MTNSIKCEPLERLIRSRRMPSLFIGSGFSKRYLINYPKWNELLNIISEKIGISIPSYTAIKNDIRNKNYGISEGQFNQILSSKLQEELNLRIKNETIKINNIFSDEELSNCVNQNIDYYKMLVAKQFYKLDIDKNKEDELKKFIDIGKKISNVYTTNYDEFLEKRVFPNFKVYNNQDKYYFRNGNGYGELFKIHGTITEPNSIIITHNDFENFDKNLKLVSAKLLNTLMDFPLIILGYSFNDDNVKKIMHDFINCFNYDILQEIKKYIIYVEYKPQEQDLLIGEKQFSYEGKTINVTTIQTDNFSMIYNYIDLLQPSATANELRKYRVLCAELIQDESLGKKRIFVKNLNDSNDEEKAIYIGAKESIEKIEKSIILYTRKEVLHDILYEKNIDCNNFAKFWYESSNISKTEYTAVFYIKKKLTIDFEQTSAKFKNNYFSRKAAFELLIKQNFRNTFNNNAELSKEIENILKANNKKARFIKIVKMLIENLISEIIDINEYERWIKLIYEYDANFRDLSDFKKAICFLHFYKYEVLSY